MHGYITGVTTLREVSGYPTVSKLPKEFEVIYGRIIEKEGDSFIELWVSYELTIIVINRVSFKSFLFLGRLQVLCKGFAPYNYTTWIPHLQPRGRPRVA